MNKERWNAQVKYNDLEGTASADGYLNALCGLEECLKQEGVDPTKFQPIGLKVYQSEHAFWFSILCKRNEELEGEAPKIVCININGKRSFEELRDILKRFELVLLSKHIQPEDYDWSEY